MKFLIHAACKLVNFLFYSNLSQTCCGFFRAIETIISIAADVMGLQGVQRHLAGVCVMCCAVVGWSECSIGQSRSHVSAISNGSISRPSQHAYHFLIVSVLLATILVVLSQLGKCAKCRRRAAHKLRSKCPNTNSDLSCRMP